MFKTRMLSLVIIVVILTSAAGLRTGQAANPTAVDGGGNPANNPWSLITVASATGDKVGQHTSIAFNMNTGTPYISYYDATHQDLYLAYSNVTNGNCGPSNSWYCEEIDTAGDVGQYSSVDYYYGNGGVRKIGIAYYDATNSALKVAIWSCPLITCGWEISTIEQGIASITQYGRYASLKFDSHGRPHISYYKHSNISDNLLKYATYVGSGGNCGHGDAASKWQCDSVHNDPNGGIHTSLAFTSNDKPYIAYYDTTPGALGLCGLDGSWSCLYIEAVGGGLSSLAIDDNDRPHIAYYKATNGALRYAQYVGTGGNCGLNGTTSQHEYQCDTIDMIGSGLGQVGLSLATDTSGYPIIAYEDASDSLGFPVLNIARPITAYSQVAGNCGPQVGLIYQWQCDTLDDATQGGGAGYLHEAEYAAVAVDATGLATIAYYEYDDYNDEGRLKVAAQYRSEKVYLPMIVR